MTDHFDLKAHLAAERAPVERALHRAVTRLSGRVAPEVAEAALHGVMTEGKRLRPILCVEAFRACGGSVTDDVYDVAAGLEMIHAYSLMHDDLPCMDDADLRRGHPTTHRVHGEDLTMVAGAALIPAAALQVLDAARRMGRDEGTCARAALVLMEAAGGGGMVGGQWLDLLGEGRRLGAEDLDDLHRRKTGALLVGSLVLGGVVGQASDPAMEGLVRYGTAIGLAFQIADDILDSTRSAEELGKHPSDQALEKSTYVSLYGLDGARAEGAGQVALAHAALDDASLPSPALHALADFVVARDH